MNKNYLEYGLILEWIPAYAGMTDISRISDLCNNAVVRYTLTDDKALQDRSQRLNKSAKHIQSASYHVGSDWVTASHSGGEVNPLYLLTLLECTGCQYQPVASFLAEIDYTFSEWLNCQR